MQFVTVIAGDCERVSPFETGEMELDESYFGARRRGRGAQKVKHRFWYA